MRKSTDTRFSRACAASEFARSAPGLSAVSPSHSQEVYYPGEAGDQRKAFQNQIDGKGFSLVEVLSSCPTNWGLRPVEAFDWTLSSMMPYYPLGVFKDFE